MLLTIDMGNTRTELCIFDDEKIVMSERIATDINKTAMEYAVLLFTLFEINEIDPKDVEGSILGSVVPPLNYKFSEAIKKVTGKKPLVVGPGVKNGLKIKIEDPKSLGADLVAASVGAIKIYGAPVIVVDMGTATTITYVDENENYLGGVFMPGVMTSLNSLATNTSQLPKIGLVAPKKVICGETIKALQSGIVYGEASMIDGMVERMWQEVGNQAKVVATGGLGKIILPYCRNEIILDTELVPKGLRLIWLLNKWKNRPLDDTM